MVLHRHCLQNLTDVQLPSRPAAKHIKTCLNMQSMLKSVLKGAELLDPSPRLPEDNPRFGLWGPLLGAHRGAKARVDRTYLSRKGSERWRPFPHRWGGVLWL